ncbi:MarR family transcriptional regulator [Streptomyces sp. NPDC006476]|uniref:MarR family winged helix-turn-helix transcriptional regulator n=1 Tax=Streptomyces sp. NPDC006476 TaxID=3157175 RepID=UPI0033A43583
MSTSGRPRGGRGRTVSVDDETLVTWWGLILEGFSHAHGRIDADLREVADLPGPWFEILLRLSRTPGRELPLTYLAKEVAFSSGGFTKMTDRLVAGGLIERRPSPTDRRVTLAGLTPQGARVLDRALQVHLDSLRRYVLEPLGAQQLEQVATGMKALRDQEG